MKNYLSLSQLVLGLIPVLISISLHSFAALPASKEPAKAFNPLISGLSAKDFVKYSAFDYSRITGKKMNLFQKVSFKVMKLKIRKQLKQQPDLMMNDFFSDKKRLGTGWIILMAVLGTLLLLLLIFAIAYSGI
jgi:hypothetical protein